jgi:hypothetical protein
MKRPTCTCDLIGRGGRVWQAPSSHAAPTSVARASRRHSVNFMAQKPAPEDLCLEFGCQYSDAQMTIHALAEGDWRSGSQSATA